MARAVFEAVADFGSLIRESKSASGALKDVDSAAAGIGTQAGRGAAQAESGLSRVGARAGVLGDQMTTAGQKATVGLTLPIVGIGVAAVKSFATFESSIVAAGTKTNATEAQLAKMKETALNMGATTKFSAGEAAAGMDILAAAGLSADEAIGTLPAVLTAAVASGEDLTLTAETVAQAMNAFGIEAGQAGHVSDVFASASNTSAISMQGLNEALRAAGQLGPSANQSLEDVVAAAANLVNQGVPAASAGTAIAQMMASLKAPGTKAAGVLTDLGIATRDANGQMLPLPQLMKNFETGMKDGTPAFDAYASSIGMTGQAARDFAMETVFGVEGAKAMNLSIAEGKPIMLDAQADAEKMTQLQKGLAKVMGEDQANAWIAARTEAGKFSATGADAVQAMSAIAGGADGASKKIADAFSDTTAQKIDNLWGSLETLGITLIGSVAPGLKTVVDAVTGFVNVVQKIGEIPGFGPLIVGAGLFLAALGPILIVLGSVMKMFDKAVAAGQRLTGKGKGLSGAGSGGGGPGGKQTLAGKVQVWWTGAMPVYLTRPIQTTGQSGVGVDGKGGKGKGSAGMAGAMGASGAMTVLPDLDGAGDAGRRMGDAVDDGMSTQVKKGGKFKKGLSALFNGSGGLARAGGAAVGGAALGAALSGGDVGAAAKGAAAAAGLEIATEHAMDGLARLGPMLSGIMPKIGAFATAVGGKLVAGLRLMGGGLRAAAVAFRTLSMAMLTNPFVLLALAVVAIAFLIYRYWDEIKAFLLAAWEVIKTAASATWNWIKMIVSTVVAAIVAAVRLYLTMLVAFWTAVWNTIKLVVTTVWNAIKAFVVAVVTAIVAAVRLYLTLLVAFWTAVWNAIKAVAAAVWAAIKAVISAGINAVRAVITAVLGAIRAAWSAAWNAIKAVASAVWGAIRAAISAGMAVVRAVISGGLAAIRGAWSAAWNGLKAVVSGVWGGIKSVVGGAIDFLRGKIDGFLGLLGKAKDLAGKIGGGLKAGAKKLIPGMSRGGLVGGSGQGDSQLRMLDPREFVLTADAVRRIGIPTLQSWNSGGRTVGGDGAGLSAAGLLQGAEGARASAGLARSGVAAAVSSPAGAKTAASTGGGVTVQTLQVNNPKPERASESLPRAIRKVSRIGVGR